MYIQNKLNKKVFIVNDDYIISGENIVTSFDEFISDNKKLIKKTNLVTLKINGSETKSFVYAFNDCDNYSIIMLNGKNEFNKKEILVLSKICDLLSIEIKNLNARRQMRNNYQNKFLSTWLAGNYATSDDIFINAKSYDLDIDINKTYCVVIVATKNAQERFTPNNTNIDRIRYYLSSHSQDLYAGYYKHLCIIFSFSDDDEMAKSKIVNNVCKQIKSILKKDVQFFISSNYNAENLNEAFNEAHSITHISQKSALTNNYITYNDLGIYTILSQVPNNNLTKQFVNKTLSPLIAYDKSHNTKLTETLVSYYNMNCNAKLTAEKNFAHYHTILYRINRIKEILAVDIDDPEVKLQLQIAIKLSSIIKDFS